MGLALVGKTFPRGLCGGVGRGRVARTRVLSLAGALNLLSAAVRRLHDFSYSAAAVLVFIVPGVNILVFLMLLALPGKAGANRFGPDPVVLKSISIEEWRRMSRGGDADAR